MNERIWHGRVIQCQNWDGKIFFFHFLKDSNLFYFLGSTKFNVAPPIDEEKERIDEWHKYLNDGGDDDE